MEKMHKWLVALLVIWGNGTFALTSVKKSCQITIHLEKKTGETQTVRFESKLKSKEHCKALAHIHRKNFDSDKIRSKKVTFVWKQTRKTIPMLAKADSRSKRPSKFNRKTRRR